jgi:SAM-dependent methyltransferase
MEDIGVGELIYEGEIYDRLNDFDFDLDFYRKWCSKVPGPVLELCCGTGRLTIPLKKRGRDISGLDITESMLETARKKAEGMGLEFLHGDIRNFELHRKFSTIFIPFNSLSHTYTVDDLERVFKSVKNHLREDGLFIFDIFNPSIHFMVEGEKAFREVDRVQLSDGRGVLVREKCAYDATVQINRVSWYFKIGDNEEVEQKLDMRCFFPLEMDAALKYNGFQVVEKFGDYAESPFGKASHMKQIYVCRIKK